MTTTRTKNRIRELRKQRDMTLEELADKVGLTHGYLSKLESGSRESRGLSTHLAERLAMALGVEPSEVMGLSGTWAHGTNGLGMAEDAEPYVPGASDVLVVSGRQRDTIDRWLVKSNALDLIGIAKGDIVVVDISQEAVDNLKPLQVVIVQVYDTDGGKLTARTRMRQFVPPRLLTTNSSGHNPEPLVLDRDDIAIKGVVVDMQRRLLP